MGLNARELPNMAFYFNSGAASCGGEMHSGASTLGPRGVAMPQGALWAAFRHRDWGEGLYRRFECPIN